MHPLFYLQHLILFNPLIQLNNFKHLFHYLISTPSCFNPMFQKIILSCPDCMSTALIEDTKTGYNVCTKCGCTVGPRLIDEGSEWRSFSDGSDPSRVGSAQNPLLNVEQLDTLISNSALARTQLKSTMRGPERQLLNGWNLISIYVDRAEMPQTVSDQAKVYYKKVLEMKITRGKNNEAVCAACIHLACKTLFCTRTFKEMSVICQVPKEEIGKVYKIIEKIFDKPRNLTTDDVMERFCSNLCLTMPEQKMAIKISKRVTALGIAPGKSPLSIAAAVIYLVCSLYGKKKLQKDICSVTNVSEATIKNTYKQIVQCKDQLVLPDEFPKEIIDSLPNS